MTVHVFLSFVEEDLNLVNLFRGQAKNDNLDLEFDDFSIKEEINSENTPYIKSVIKDKIKRSSLVLCLVGSHTHESDWVNWEITTGYDLDKCIIGVKLNSDENDTLPNSLIIYKAEIVPWKIDEIMLAIKTCCGL